MSRNRLTGTIPPALGRLSRLEELALRGNALTGNIPSGLEDLDLEYLYLSGNALSGCVPPGLRDVANNDLNLLRLNDCERPSCVRGDILLLQRGGGCFCGNLCGQCLSE